MEKINYNYLAQDYHQKRKEPWKPLMQFLGDLDKNHQYSGQFYGYTIDLGCANGRNFKVLFKKNSKLVGIDNSIEFLKIANKHLRDNNRFSKSELNSIQLLLSDILFLPIRPQVINNIFSIATLHHIRYKLERKNVILQLYNLLKQEGYILLSVWRKYQKKYKKFFISDWLKRKFKPMYNKKQKSQNLNDHGDIFVPWTISKEKITYNRFYHLFSNIEIKKLLRLFNLKIFKKMGGPHKRDNFFILAQKS